jgi:hypothetical protein
MSMNHADPGRLAEPRGDVFVQVVGGRRAVTSAMKCVIR